MSQPLLGKEKEMSSQMSKLFIKIYSSIDLQMKDSLLLPVKDKRQSLLTVQTRKKKLLTMKKRSKEIVRMK